MKYLKIAYLTLALVPTMAKPNQAAPQPNQLLSINIKGEVQKPGSYTFSKKCTLLDSLTMAGGMKLKPEQARLNVQRANKTIPINAVKLMRGHDLTQNLTLQSGDIVLVQKQIPPVIQSSTSAAAMMMLAAPSPSNISLQVGDFLCQAKSLQPNGVYKDLVAFRRTENSKKQSECIIILAKYARQDFSKPNRWILSQVQMHTFQEKGFSSTIEMEKMVIGNP